MKLRLATRGSALARWQADYVAAGLRTADSGIEVEIVVVSTSGDRDKTSPLAIIGGKGVFVKEVQSAVLDGRADLAVHSAKDLPAVTPSGLAIAAVPPRADPRDALVGASRADLSSGATVATGSARRRVQLAALVPELRFVELRGNIDTRLQVAASADVDAVIVAKAALDRLGWSDAASEVLDPVSMVPQVGQGALAIECRADDEACRNVLGALDHGVSHAAVGAERSFLTELGGDCELPAGAHVVDTEDDRLTIHAVLATDDGSSIWRHEARGDDGVALGRDTARRLLDRAEASGWSRP